MIEAPPLVTRLGGLLSLGPLLREVVYAPPPTEKDLGPFAVHIGCVRTEYLGADDFRERVNCRCWRFVGDAC